MPIASPDQRLAVPKNWQRSIQSAILQVIALAKYALVYTRGWAGDSSSQRVRLAAKANHFEQEIALLREESRIKDARMARIPGSQRPHYVPTERLAILELRAARGWSLARTAKVFQVTAATIASWNKRLDEEGPAALLSILQPVNKFPDFVRYLVQRLQILCPRLGKVKIAQILARAGLHLGVSTVGRLRRQPPARPKRPTIDPKATTPRIVAKYPNHICTLTSPSCRRWRGSGHRGCRSPCLSVGRFAGGWRSRSIIFRAALWAISSSKDNPRLKKYASSLAALSPASAQRPSTWSRTGACSLPATHSIRGVVGKASAIERAQWARAAASRWWSGLSEP